MLRPVIMLGCGGSGQKAVRYVRDAVRRRLEHADWDGGIPRSWQFLAFDTVDKQESPGEIPTIPVSDYTSIALSFQSYTALEGALLAQYPPSSDGYKELIGWRPDPADIEGPLKLGAGAIRAVGRAAGVLAFPQVVRPKLEHAFKECTAGLPELERLCGHLKIKKSTDGTALDPIVIVLGSMAGGTGAGMMLDLIDLVRRTNIKGGFPIAIVFSADIFGSKQNDSMAANGLGFMSELMSSYWDSEVSGAGLIPSQVPVSNRGPHAVYLVGRKNMDGIDLENSTNVYRAVGEALSGWVTSPQVQTGVIEFTVANWTKKANENLGGYPFDKGSQPGVVSSFGSATISIGRDRFKEYSEKLLMREILEFLDHGHILRKRELVSNFTDDMTPEAVKSHIVRNERENFLRECQIAERGDLDNQITEVFLDSNSKAAEREAILGDIKSQLLGEREWAQWKLALQSQFDFARRASNERANKFFREKVAEWGSQTFERILRVSSEYCAKFGLAVTLDLLRFSQHELHEVALELRQKGNAAQNNSSQKISYMVSENSDDESGSLIASWPTEGGGVPPIFLPSPVEFFLEDPATWQTRLEDLINRAGSPQVKKYYGTPIQNARFEIISQEYSSDNSKSIIRPLVWTNREFDGHPQWVPGNAVQVVFEIEQEELQDRVRSWMRRPGLPLQLFMKEGLRDYLNHVDSQKEPVLDHMARVANFRQKLNEALNQSKPLIEIDLNLNSIVHNKKKVETEAIIQGFPFPNTHPARSEVEDLIRPRLAVGEDLTKYFTDRDTESVLISSLLTYPIHPMCVLSFTQPINQAMTPIKTDAAVLRGSFWQWARTKTLEDAIPLSDETRRTIIRGFAVGRLLGFVTADPDKTLEISGKQGERYRFPEVLLTSSGVENLLPALLESIVLTYADVSTKGEKAFIAYQALHELGNKTGSKFAVVGDLDDFLKNGNISQQRIVDQFRANFMLEATTFDARRDKLLANLDSNIGRYLALKDYSFNGREHRTKKGLVEPEHTQSIELLDDLLSGYQDVRSAVTLAASTGGLGV